MLIDELKEEFMLHGITLELNNNLPDELKDWPGADRYPLTWVDEENDVLCLSRPEEAKDFECIYILYEALGLFIGFDIEGAADDDPAQHALLNAWVLDRAIKKVGDNKTVIAMLKRRVAQLSMSEETPKRSAYRLWSRMAAADNWDLLRPIKMIDPDICAMIEQLREKWKVPATPWESEAMYHEDPIRNI